MKPKLLLMISLCTAMIVVAVLHFRYNVFARAAPPSVCMAGTTGDLGMDLLTLAGFHQVPEGISIPFTHESDAEGHQVATVAYRDRAYSVKMRKDGIGVCLDFNPPLPLKRSKWTIKADLNTLQNAVYDRWPYALGLAARWCLASVSGKTEIGNGGQRGSPATLVDVLPELAQELKGLLKAQGESNLAGQISDLVIVDRCRCGDDFLLDILHASEARWRL